MDYLYFFIVGIFQRDDPKVKLKELKIKTIINLSMVILFVTILFFGVLSVWSSNYLWNTSTSVYDHPFKTTQLLHELEIAKNSIKSEVTALVLEKDKQIINAEIIKINSYEKIVLEKIKGLKESYLGPVSNLNDIQSNFNQYMLLTYETIRLYENDETSTVLARLSFSGEDFKQFNKVNASIEVVDLYANAKANQFYQDAQKQKNTILIGLLLFLGVIILLLWLINTLLKKGILDPIQKLISEAKLISEGELNTRDTYQAENEVGQFSKSFNKMTETFPSNLKNRTNRVNELGLILKQTEALNERLSKAEKYNRNLIESSLDSFVTIGTDGLITDVNSATEKATGLSREQLVQTHFSDYFTEPIAALMGYKKAFRDSELFDYNLEIKHVDGHTTPVLYNASVYKDSQGNIEGVFATSRDISSIVKAQNELIELKNSLVSAVKELEALSYSVSHDLKAPLREIKGNTSLLLKKYAHLLSEEGNHYLDNIRSSSTALQELIDGLLQFSITGQAEMNPSQLNMKTIVKELIQPIQDNDLNHRIEWEIDDLPQGYGDLDLMKSVWANLIENAVKFSGKKAMAIIHIGAIESDKETTYFVSDNGVGFDMEYASKLFSLFQRLHSHEEFEGTGVGLASVRSIMNRHNGKTWAVGEIDKGACIYFSLNK